MDVLETFANQDWQEQISAELQLRAVNALENGKLLYLPNLNFNLLPAEKRFLSATYADPKNKNISFNQLTNQIAGVSASQADQHEIKNLLQRFSRCAAELMQNFFPGYLDALQAGRTSFRPAEIGHRKLSYRKDDTRLHVDAFPASPNQGKRILRVFTNINPNGWDRVWRVGEPFESVAQRFLPSIRRPFPGSGFLLRALKITKSRRTAYDHIMLQLHDRMKADIAYQREVTQMEVRFPSATTWVVFTDQVSHAAMSGQHVLEQTFYLPVAAMQDEQRSPLRVLERLAGVKDLNK